MAQFPLKQNVKLEVIDMMCSEEVMAGPPQLFYPHFNVRGKQMAVPAANA